MACYIVEQVLSDEELEHQKPFLVRIWADRCKVESGTHPLVLFMMNDNRMVAELEGVYNIRGED